MQALTLAIDLVGRRTEPSQHSFGHRQRNLPLARKHVLGAGVPQLRHIA
jgi:hypothetical protein